MFDLKSVVRLCLVLFSITLSLSLSSQDVIFQKEDLNIYGKYIEVIKSTDSRDKQDILQTTAEFFLSTPYVAATLEQGEKETLVINLRQLDCVTYIETVIALSNTVNSGDLSFLNFVSNLRKIRYRNGEVKGYASRLHYTSDWIYENQQKGVLASLDLDSSLVLEDKTINFMSAHRHAYKSIKEDDEMLDEIKSIEDNINKRGGFWYLPKGKIEENTDKIPHMAMIAFTTRIEGLDTTHTGFTYKKSDGTLGFIHASSLKKKVVIDTKKLSDYCNSQRACTGIIIMKVE